MNLWLADIRLAIMVFLQLFSQALELASADIFKIDAVWSRSRSLIKENRYAVTLPYLVANALGQRNTILNRHAVHGNKRNDVRRANARMCPSMLGHVDEF